MLNDPITEMVMKLSLSLNIFYNDSLFIQTLVLTNEKFSFGAKLNVLKSFSFRKTEGNKNFPFNTKLKDFPVSKKSKHKEDRTKGNKGTQKLG